MLIGKHHDGPPTRTHPMMGLRIRELAGSMIHRALALTGSSTRVEGASLDEGLETLRLGIAVSDDPSAAANR